MCSDSGEVGAWEEFVRRFHRLIAKIILRTCNRFGSSTNQIVDELIQDTYVKLCADDFRLLRDFDHRHPAAFLGYLQVVARNVALDYFKSLKRKHDQVEPLPEGPGLAASDETAGSQKKIERNALIEQIDQHLELCAKGPDRDRNRRVFWLRHSAGLTAAEIANLPGINLTGKGVESLDLRLMNCLRERIASGRRERSDTKQNPDEGILPAESF